MLCVALTLAGAGASWNEQLVGSDFMDHWAKHHWSAQEGASSCGPIVTERADSKSPAKSPAAYLSSIKTVNLVKSIRSLRFRPSSVRLPFRFNSTPEFASNSALGHALPNKERDATLSADMTRRLSWYVSFNDFFRYYHDLPAAEVLSHAAALIQQRQTLSWQNHSSANAGQSPLLFFLRRGSQDRAVAAHTAANGARGERIDFSWIDAPKSKARALVCVASEQRLAVIAVRGSVNMRNILKALKVWSRA